MANESSEIVTEGKYLDYVIDRNISRHTDYIIKKISKKYFFFQN